MGNTSGRICQRNGSMRGGHRGRAPGAVYLLAEKHRLQAAGVAS